MRRSCAVTGPKPTRFKFGYKEDYSLCKKIKKAMQEQFKRLYNEKGVRRFYIGGSIGVHIWAGELILQMKAQPGYEDIELDIVLLFLGHSAKWDIRSRRRLDYLLKNCTEQLIVGDRSSPESYIKQNRYLVDRADFLVAVSDGEGEMVGYARKKRLGVLCIHPDTAAVNGDVWDHEV